MKHFPTSAVHILQQFPVEAVAKIERDVCIVKTRQDEVKKGGQKVTLCYIGYTKQTNKQTNSHQLQNELPRVCCCFKDKTATDHPTSAAASPSALCRLSSHGGATLAGMADWDVKGCQRVSLQLPCLLVWRRHWHFWWQMNLFPIHFFLLSTAGARWGVVWGGGAVPPERSRVRTQPDLDHAS